MLTSSEFGPPFFSRRREVNNYLPLRGESEKLEKTNGSMMQGQVFLKGVAGAFPI